MMDIAGYVAAAEIVYGNNAENGAPEVFVGTSGDVSGAQYTWDEDPNNGFDTGWVSVRFHAKASGGTDGVTWDINNGAAIVNNSSADYDYINGIIITASVSGSGMSMAWKSLEAIYYYEGEMVEQITVGSASWPSANTMGQTTDRGFQEDCFIEASDTPNDEIIVTGLVRFTMDSGIYPPANAMAAQIFILPQA